MPYSLIRDDGARLIAVVPRKGPTLRERWLACRTEGRRGLPRPELLVALKNVARTLDVLSSRSGAPHLALNTETVQLVGGQGLASDFGLAAWFWLPSGQSLADVNPRYAAPEMGMNAVSRFCDPYSLALVYQEMLTGVHPLGVGARPTARAYSQPDLSPLDAADRAVLARALDRTASRRFGSCMELIAALEQGGEKAAAPAALTPAETSQVVPPRPASILAEVIADRRERLAGGQARPVPLHGPARRTAAARVRGPRRPRIGPAAAGRLLPPLAGRANGRARRRPGVPQAARCPVTSRPTKRRTWRRLRPDKSSFFEIVLRFHAHPEPPLAGVHVEAKPVGCGPARAKQLLDETGPLLLDALRGALQAHPDRRRQDRVRFDQPVMVCTVAEDGSPETTIHARARDLSRTGMGLLLPVKPATRKVLIHLSLADDAPPTAVPARLVRLQPRDEGFEAGALFLGGDG